MKRKAGGVLHLWRILLAAAATASTCASAKTSCAAQGIFRAGNRQTIVTFGWSSRAFLLIDTHVHSAAQASAATHMF